MAQTKIKSGLLEDNISIVGNLTVDTNTLFVDSANNRVGIGTLSPATDLDITKASSAQFKVGNGTQYVRLYADADEATILADGSVEMRFYTGGTKRMGIDSTGNIAMDTNTLYVDAVNNRVGIGTVSPSSALHISSTSGTKALFERTGSTGAYIGLKDNSGSLVYLGDNNGTFEVQTAGSSYSTKLAVTSSGNVGIGTTSPSTKIHIQTSAATDSARFTDGTNSELYIKHSTGNLLTLATGSTSQPLAFATGASERMRIDSNGDVLIGQIPSQSSSNLTARRNGANIEFGHANNSGGYYGTLGVHNTNGMPYIGFSCDADSSGNTFTTRGIKGNIITGESNGDLIFKQLTTASASGQTATERMRIDSSGNVGIGVTPSAWSSPNFTVLQLGVGASIGGRGSVGTGDQVYIQTNAYYDGTNWKYIETNSASNYYQDNGEHVWRTAASGTAGTNITFTERMRITNTGNVGIGVTPTSVTHGPHLEVGNLRGTVSAGTGYFEDNGSTNFLNGARPLAFGVAGSERMRINSSGNVGIGTTSPSTLLHIQSNSAPTLTIDHTEKASWSVGDVVGKVDFYTSDASGNAPYSAAFIQTENETGAGTLPSGALVFGTATYNAVGGAVERMRINASGNVGIGTTSPAAKLEIYSTILNNQLYLVSPDTGQAGINFGGTSAKTKGRISYSDNSDAMYIFTNSTERMRITSEGSTLFQGTTTTYLTEFSNTAATSVNDIMLLRYSGATPNNTSDIFLVGADAGFSRFVIYSNGDMINRNGSYGSYSDIKLKENITDASPKLDDLMQVKIRNYNLIGEEIKQLGVVAQELEEVFPALVSESPDFEEQEVTDAEGNITTKKVDLGTTTKSVKYSVFVPMLIKAMQEQQEIINDLKARIETLENK